MMIATILIATLCLVNEIQSETGVCRGKGWGPGRNEDYRKYVIFNCTYFHSIMVHVFAE